MIGQQWWKTVILAIAAIWLGALLGVSFLATPAKFLAPSLSLPVALEVGRYTFAVFNKVEWLLAVLLFAAVIVGDWTRLGTIVVASAIMLVAAETFWLLPALDQRVELIIAGQQPAPSSLHNLYIAVELAKLLVLMLLIVAVARRLVRLPSSPVSDGLIAR